MKGPVNHAHTVPRSMKKPLHTAILFAGFISFPGKEFLHFRMHLARGDLEELTLEAVRDRFRAIQSETAETQEGRKQRLHACHACGLRCKLCGLYRELWQSFALAPLSSSDSSCIQMAV